MTSFVPVVDAKTGYDSIKASTYAERRAADTYRLRTFNNCIKAYLISKYCPMFCSVLDLASGKGGDLTKYALKEISSIVLADISPESVIESCRKIQINRSSRRLFSKCQTRFIIGDTFSNPLRGLPDNLFFHLTSCQMALHYSFKTEEMARQAISNLTERLVPGGFCIITTINAPKLVEQFMQYGKDRNRLQNSIYFVERHFELNDLKPFGCGYQFWLNGSVPGVDEYLVHPQVLIDLFSDYGCKFIRCTPFQEFHNEMLSHPESELWTDPYTREIRDPRQIFLDINLKAASDLSSTAMTPDEWEVIGLYSFYVFQKEGTLNIPRSNDQPNQPPVRKFQYIDAETGEVHEQEIPPAK